jgi:hypothetical protein
MVIEVGETGPDWAPITKANRYYAQDTNVHSRMAFGPTPEKARDALEDMPVDVTADYAEQVETGQYEGHGYRVTLHTSTQYSTVYRRSVGEMPHWHPVGTLQRARHNELGASWRLYNLRGELIRTYRMGGIPLARVARIAFEVLRRPRTNRY